MNKKYIVRLTAKERRVLREVVKQLSGSSQKVRRAQMLLKADVAGPAWTDEPRAAAVLSPEVHQAAAVITFLSPGLRFFHQGQFEGRRRRISPHLCRAPEEPTDSRMLRFYDRLLALLRQPVVRDGKWQKVECTPAWDGNWTTDCFVAFSWQGPGDERWVVTTNYAPNQSQCYVRLPFEDLAGRPWRLQDQMEDVTYDRDGNDLQARGLYLDVPAWQISVFALTPGS